MDAALLAGGLLVGLVLGLGVALLVHRRQLSSSFVLAQEQSKKILEEARKESENIAREAMAEAKRESQRRRQVFENEAKQRRQEISKLENKLKDRERNLDKKLEILDKREAELEGMGRSLKGDEQRYRALQAEAQASLEESRRTLQNIAKMSPEEARRELMKSIEVDARRQAQENVRKIEAEARQEAELRARSVVSLAVQRIASEHVNDTTVTVVSLPSDEMKGRIIGREGRNIRALEQAAGIDLIIDDTPEAVIVSSFNPVRREVAKIALGRLIADGRIHPARIEETVRKVEADFKGICREQGEQAAFDVGLTDVHPELIQLLGNLRYRSTGNQPVLQHSVEVARIAGIMASELGLNVKVARRCGLLHDVGKAADQEVDGHHAVLGADLCKKYGEADVVVDAIRLHHADDLNLASPYAVVLHAANLLSENRPGARMEQMEAFVTRLDDMERLVRSFAGIETAYVMQAGRDVRALVTPTIEGDQGVIDLSNEIASRLRKELTFPGQVRVTVVRESKSVEFAK